MKKLIFTLTTTFALNGLAAKPVEYFENSDKWDFVLAESKNENVNIKASFFKTNEGAFRWNRFTGIQLLKSEVIFNYKDSISQKEQNYVCNPDLKYFWARFKIPDKITLKIQRSSFSSLNRFLQNYSPQEFNVTSIDNPVVSSQIIDLKMVDQNNNPVIGKFSGLQNMNEKISTFDTGYMNKAYKYINQQLQSQKQNLFDSNDLILDLTPYWGLACDIVTEKNYFPFFEFYALAERTKISKSAWISLHDFSEIAQSFVETPISIKKVSDLDSKNNIVALALNLGANLEKSNLLDKVVNNPKRLHHLYENLESLFKETHSNEFTTQLTSSQIEKSYQNTHEIQLPDNMMFPLRSAAVVMKTNLKIEQNQN